MSHGTVILLCPQWEIFILRRLWAERCTPPCQAFSGMLLCSHCLYSKCVTDWASPEPSIFPAQHLPSPCPFLQHPFISKQCLLQKRSQNLRLGTHQSKSRHHICTPPPHATECWGLLLEEWGDCREIPGEPPHNGADTFHSSGSSCYSQTGFQHSKLLKQRHLAAASIPEPAVTGCHSVQINSGHLNTVGKCLLLENSHFWASGILPFFSASQMWLQHKQVMSFSF